MITLYGFGPMFGLPDPSPFVLKTMTQLKMSGLPFGFQRADRAEAPKGKIPSSAMAIWCWATASSSSTT